MPQPLSGLRDAAIAASLRACRLFSDLPADDLRAVTALVSVQTLERDDYLFHEGDPSTGFYLVQKGAINVHRVNAAGKEQVIHVFRAGETFAEAALVTDRGYPADARAVEASQVLVIQRAGFIGLLKRQPEIGLRLLASMSLHLRVLVSQLEDLTLKDVETRLIHWLLQRCPDPASRSPVTLELHGTKRVLAAELGTVSETLSRSLAKLRSQQMIA
ncbi:MAG: Crp/Fnr family transcriptional regulator, partial [Verrucomicrobia bacterium]|nr:Crp/Fnr family transcriptional regulator [Verrucomicrobiota bacterium]